MARSSFEEVMRKRKQAKENGTYSTTYKGDNGQNIGIRELPIRTDITSRLLLQTNDDIAPIKTKVSTSGIGDVELVKTTKDQTQQNARKTQLSLDENTRGLIDDYVKASKNPLEYMAKHDAEYALKQLGYSEDEIKKMVKAYKQETEGTYFQKGSFGDNEGNVATDAILGIGNTGIDIGLGAVKGALSLAEGVKDLATYGVSGVASLLGANDAASKLKKHAEKSDMETIFGNVDKQVDRYSFLGEKSEGVTQGIGQVAGIMATAGLGQAAGIGAKGVNALTTGTMFASSSGSGMSEAYQDGASDEVAIIYGATKGAVDTLSEMMFGGLGKGVNAIGLSSGLSSADDMIAKKLSSKISNQIAKNLVEYGVKSSAEGFEEVVAGSLTAVAKKLTYKSEEELNKLIEDEKLLDQFIAGAVASGISQSGVVPGMKKGGLLEANNTGRDFVTGYTQNEQKVIDKEVERRIAEKEADETKVTLKEKKAIIEQVQKDLEKGYISIDTIESTLGGETYNSYKSIVDQESKLQEEIKKLEEMPNAQITVKQNERLQEARKQLEELQQNSNKTQLKDQLSKEVQELIKNDKLSESYNEKSRRSQTFETDVSKYDAKQQATIQKAIDSGILNNTNRTHEFVDMIAKISADKGVSFDFTDNKKLKESGFALEGKNVNGYIKDGNITLNVNSAKALNKVVGHEITHVLEGSDLYAELQEAVKAYATTKGEYKSKLEAITKLYEGVEGANVEQELTADLIGEYLFTDEAFVQQLSSQNRNIFQKIYDEIKYLCKVVSSGSKEAKQLEKVKKIFDEAYRENTQIPKNDKVKYYLSKVPENHIRLSEMEKTMQITNKKYYVPKEFKSAIMKEGDIVDVEEFEIVRSEVFKKANSARMSGQPIMFEDYVFSSNHIFYYSNYTETEFFVEKIIEIDDALNSELEEEYNAQRKQRNSTRNSERDGTLKSFEGNNAWNGQRDGHGGTSTGNVEILERKATEQTAGNGESKRIAFVENNSEKMSSDDGIFFDEKNSSDLKQKQLDIVLKTNQADNDYVTWIRKKDDILTFEEALNSDDYIDYKGDDFDPSYPYSIAEEALRTGKITVYSSYPIKQGVFVSPSYMEAQSYSGNGRVYSKEVNLTDVAWIDPTQGQYANTSEKYSLSNDDIAPSGNWKVKGSDLALDGAPIRQDIAPAQQSTTETKAAVDDIAPWTEEAEDLSERPFTPVEEDTVSTLEDEEELQMRESDTRRVKNIQANIQGFQVSRDVSEKQFNESITKKQEEYDSLKRKDTLKASKLLTQINDLKVRKESALKEIDRKIKGQREAIDRIESQARARQRKSVQKVLREKMRALMGDTFTWKDKKTGFGYQTQTFKRNLRDTVRDANGNQDIAKADAIYEELQGAYNHHEAELNRESNRIKQEFRDMNITKEEDVYAQMLGEYRHNPECTLTPEVMREYLEKNRNKIDTAKVDKIIERARIVYDSLYSRVNEVLRAQGMKEIGYREGYFPHFTEESQNWLAKIFNWKVQNNNIPTDIAGLTEQFTPDRSWQSFNKHRTSDVTGYNFSKGLDTYVQGALDWIYHIEDIQKRRAFENEIRYQHSDKGVQELVDDVHNNPFYDADQMQEEIDRIYKNAKNPLNNFVQDLRKGTNVLAGKKDSSDRSMESRTNRQIYSTMTNISSRVSANMVAGSISSALTNFIPITQSWGQVSPISSLKAMKDTMKSIIVDDEMVAKSDFLTNRLRNSENLYKSGWDKASEKVGFLMEAVDGFTSQTVWRSKYAENLKSGMNEAAAIKDADQFAENVMAGRSRGNMPTIFNEKNLVTRTLTAFQLEVANQYGYMFKDMPQDMRNESVGKLVKGYATMFLGSYAYNALYSSLTGRDAAFDPVGIIEELLRDFGLFGDDEEEEPVDAVVNLATNIVEEIPFVGGLIGGGRIPISSALPYDGFSVDSFTEMMSDISEGDWKNVGMKWLNPVYYLLMPMGGGQLKKTVEGLSMFDNDLPIAGSYTDSGNLRFPVEDTTANKIQAAVFGQYANENARDYFDNERAPLKAKQIEEYKESGLSIQDYWDYREGLKGLNKLEEKADYIANLDFPISTKNTLINNISDRDEDIDLTDYSLYEDFEEFDLYITNPGKYAVSKAVGGYKTYNKYTKALNGIIGNKDSNGNTVSGSRKQKVINYINGLEADYGEKLILFKNEYPADDTYNAEIVEYLNKRSDISYSDMETILKELGFTVDSDGTVRW